MMRTAIVGFWGGWDRARRLEIMKDSQIGTYGVMALLLGFALRWWALEQLFTAGHILNVTLGVAVLSRGGIPLLMRWLPAARTDGLSRWVGRPGILAVLLGAFLSVALGLVCLGPAAVLVIALQLACLGGLALLAHRKIAGQTGDVLGAAQQVSEIAALIVLAALVLA